MTVHDPTRGAPAAGDVRNNSPSTLLGTQILEDTQVIIDRTDTTLNDILTVRSIIFMTPDAISWNDSAILSFPTSGLIIDISHNVSGVSFQYKFLDTEVIPIPDNNILYAVLDRNGAGTGTTPSTILSIGNGNLVVAPELPAIASDTIWFLPICKRRDNPNATAHPYLYWFFSYGVWIAPQVDLLGAAGSGTTILTAYTTFPTETIIDGGIISSSIVKGFQYRPVDSASNITISATPFGLATTDSPTRQWDSGTVITILNKSIYNMTLTDGETVQYGLDLNGQLIVLPPGDSFSMIYDTAAGPGNERWLPIEDVDNAFVTFPNQTIPHGGFIDISSNTSMQKIPVEGVLSNATATTTGSTYAEAIVTTNTFAYALYEGTTYKAVNAGTLGNSIILSFDGIKTIDQAVNEWNSVNFGNQVSYFGNPGTTVPSAGVVTLVLYPVSQTLASLNPIASGSFGYSVSLTANGDRAVVSAWLETVAALTSAGRVYVYSIVGDIWTLEQQITSPNNIGSGYFGCSAVISADGTRLAVGAMGETTTLAGAGRVHIFLRTGTVWALEQSIATPNPIASGYFGYSVFFDDDAIRIAVGAYGENGGAAGSGRAYVYSRVGTVWTLEQAIVSPNIIASGAFGSAVSMPIDGTRLVIGAPFETYGSATAGRAYVYSRTGTVWSLEQGLFSTYPIVNGNYGCNATFSGDGLRVAISAGREEFAPPPGSSYIVGAGAVYVYIKSGTSWVLEQRITSPNAVTNGYFGYYRTSAAYGSIGLLFSRDGKNLLVGAVQEFVTSVRAGRVYLYTLSNAPQIPSVNIVPYMSNYTVPSGYVASASSELATYLAWESFGSVNTTDADGWLSANPAVYPVWLKIQLPLAIRLTTYKILQSNEGTVITASPKDWLFQGSNDGTTWVTLDTQVARPSQQQNELRTYSVTTTSNYSQYRIYVTANNGHVYTRIGKLILEGYDPTNPPVSQYVWLLSQSLYSPNYVANGYVGVGLAMTSNASLIVAGSYGETSSAVISGRAYAFKSDSKVDASLINLLNSSNKIASGNYGRSVSISYDGTRAVVGAPNEFVGVAGAGRVYVYVKNAGVWTLEQTINSINSITNGAFGFSVYMDSTGTRVFIGAQKESSGGVVGGLAYVYTRVGTIWNLERTFISPNNILNGNFGTSGMLNTDGSRLVIGATGETVTALLGAGRAYVYLRTGTTWGAVPEGSLVSGIPATNGYFGYSVSIDDNANWVVVGAYNETYTFAGAGNVWNFQRTGVTWVQESRLTSLTTAIANGQFGVSVFISGDGTRIFVGAPQETNVVATAGRVHVYNYSAGWNFEKHLTSPNSIAGGNFGYSVSANVNGSFLLVGAVNEYVSNIQGGRSYLFSRSGTNYILQQTDVSSNLIAGGNFGYAVGLASNGYLIGARNETATAITGAGNSYFFGYSVSNYLLTLSKGDTSRNIRFIAEKIGDVGNTILLSFDGDKTVKNTTDTWNSINSSNRVMNDAIDNDYIPTDSGGSFPLSGGGMLEDIIFTAVNSGDAGSSITLNYDGIKTVESETIPWNANNPQNQVAFTGSGKAIPVPGVVKLSSGAVIISTAVFGSPVGTGGTAASATTPAYSTYAMTEATVDTFAYNTYSGTTYIAVNSGLIGNGISLFFDGIKTIDQIVTDWNNANSGNPVRVVYGAGLDGTNVPPIGAISLIIPYQLMRNSILSPNSIGNGGFGTGVSYSGDGTRVAIGAYSENGGAVGSGRAYVYRVVGDNWELEQSFTSPNFIASGFFGIRIALNKTGTVLVVGARGESYAGVASGRVYVYVRSGTLWTLFQPLVSPNPIVNGYFGGSLINISDDGTRIVLAGFGETVSGQATAGRVYVYRFDSSVYNLEQAIESPNVIASGNFGATNGINSDASILVIGASSESGGAATSGRAYVYTRSGILWSLSQSFVSPNIIAAGRFGSGVDISKSGNRIAIGALGELGSGISASGRAYTYTKVNNTWTLETTFVSPNALASGGYGVRTALDEVGNNLVVTSQQETNINTAAGRGYRYSLLNSVWTLIDILGASNPSVNGYFGYEGGVSITYNGKNIAIGAYAELGTSSAAGRVFLFSQVIRNYNLQQSLISSNPVLSGNYGIGIAYSEDGTRVAIGAHAETGAFAGMGRVYVYRINGAEWILEQQITSPNAIVNGYFGYRLSLSADGSRLVIGAISETQSVAGSGRAYVYLRTGTTWALESSLLSTNPIYGGRIGDPVAISGDGLTIAVSAYSESTDIVPLMTAASTPTGWTATASSSYGASYEPFRAFDANNTTTGWLTANTVYTGWLQIQLPVAKIVKQYSIACYPDASNRKPSSWTFQGSNNGSTWTTIDTQVGITGWGTVGAFKIFNVSSNNTAYLYYRLDITANVEGTTAYIAITSLELSTAITSVIPSRGSGRVYVHRFNGSIWELEQEIYTPNPIVDGNFGTGLVLSYDGSTLAIGAASENGGAAKSGRAYVYTRSGSVWNLEQSFTSPNFLTNGYFGYKVSLSGQINNADTLAVGAFGEANLGLASVGRAYVYTRSTGIWTPKVTLVSPNIMGNGVFGYIVVLSNSGTRMLVGAYSETVGTLTNAGRVYLFELINGNWELQASLYDQVNIVASGFFGVYGAMALDGRALLISAQNSNASGVANSGRAYSYLSSEPIEFPYNLVTSTNPITNGAFGSELAISADGSRIAVSAINETVSGIVAAGRLYIYSVVSGTSTLEQILTSPFAMTNGYFSRFVEMTADGTRLICAAHNETVGVTGAGRAYIYLRTGTVWNLEQTLTSPNPIAAGSFGVRTCISKDGTRAVVGAYLETYNAIATAGRVYIYLRTGSAWNLEATLNSPNATTTGYFGAATAITDDGSRLVVGSFEPGGAPTSGRGYVYLRTGTTWSLEATLISVNPVSNGGYSNFVNIDSGNRIVIGAHSETASGVTTAGRLYVYLRSGTIWNLEQILISPNAFATGAFGIHPRINSNGDFLIVGAHQETVSGFANAGRSYLYTRTGTVWSLKQTFTSNFNSYYSVLNTGAKFGASSAINLDGTRVIVGASGEMVNAVAGVGRAYSFDATASSSITLKNGLSSYLLKFIAQTAGTIGNTISLVFNGDILLNSAVNSWNTANGLNQVSFTPSSPADLMMPATVITLQDAVSDQVTVFNADTIGSAGNNIALSFNGSQELGDVLLGWNNANPANTVSTATPGYTILPSQFVKLSGGTDGYGTMRDWYDSILIQLIGFGNELVIKHLDEDWGQLLDQKKDIVIKRGASAQFILDKTMKRWFEVSRTKADPDPVVTTGYVLQSDGKSLVYAPVQKVYHVVSATEIDWASAHVFYKSIFTNTVFTFINQQDGHSITLTVNNSTGSPVTITLPISKWAGGGVVNTLSAAQTITYSIDRINGENRVVSVMIESNYQVLPAFDINFSSAITVFYKSISLAQTFTFSNQVNGQTVILAINNSSGADITNTFPVCRWVGGIPRLTILASTTTVYTIARINDLNYVTAVENMK